jgi:hypothetical protein
VSKSKRCAWLSVQLCIISTNNLKNRISFHLKFNNIILLKYFKKYLKLVKLLWFQAHYHCLKLKFTYNNIEFNYVLYIFNMNTKIKGINYFTNQSLIYWIFKGRGSKVRVPDTDNSKSFISWIFSKTHLC